MFVPIINCLVTPVISSWFFGMAWMFFKYEKITFKLLQIRRNDERYQCTKRMGQRTLNAF